MDDCIFKIVNRCCGSKRLLQTGGIARIHSITDASKLYEDELHTTLEEQITKDQNTTIRYHNSCVSTYVSKSHIERFLKRKSRNTDETHEKTVKRARRSDLNVFFCFRQHCLICSEECVMDFDQKNPNRWRRVVVCRTADREGQKTFKQSIINTCDARQDELSHEVKRRVLSAVSDLHAADARYHKDCFVKFMSPRSVATAQRKTKSSQKEVEDSAFYSVTFEMNEDRGRIWNSVEVHSLYESKEGKILSRRNLVVKLSQHFGSDLLVLSGRGVANILVFRSKASSSLCLIAKEEDDEIEIALETTAQKIQSEAKDLAADKMHYNARLNMQEVLGSVSPTLLVLMGKLSHKLEHTMPAALIGNIVTSLVTNSTTTLQIALGVVLGKRALIEQFNDFAVACTYDEILRFKASAATAAFKNSNLAGLEAPKDGLIQVVADNFDANISSQNGLVNTHSLAMMLTVSDDNHTTEKEDGPETFPRLSTQDARSIPIQDIQIERYKGPKKPEMPASEALRTVLPLCVLAHQVISLSRARNTDFDFLCDIVSKEGTPEFKGYNTQLAREQGCPIKPQTRAIYRPLIDMSPADPDTILTAMVDAQETTNSCGQEVTIFTNDQQLYKVAVGIKWVYQDRFLNVIPRLGGMHFLMSFIGSVGTLMVNTGLEEVLKAAFGGVSHMLSGKKFPQNARALRIVVEEVISSIVQNVTSGEDLVVSLDVKAGQSKTAMVWVNCLIKPVLLMMLYIRAEREADWPLHLYAVKEMLPYFFAAGHHNYARYGTYYLRSMERLPDDVLRHFMKGHHVMRHKPGIWNAVWSDMFIESTFMRYGHGAGGIIGITLKPSALKKWAFSMHISSQLKQDVAEMSKGYKETEVTTHKEEKPSRIRADHQDRLKIREKLQLSIDPLDSLDHPDGILNVVTGLIAPPTVNVEQAVKIGKAQMESFENALPSGFYGPISKQVVTMNVANKSVTVAGKDVYDVNLIYTRVLGLQQSRDIDLADVLKHELSPLPTSIFKESGEMRMATGKSILKNKLKVTVSARHVQPDSIIMDGCAILWCVHWPCKGTVQNYIDNFCSYIIQKTITADVYLVFDRYFEYSIKSAMRSTRSGQHASRRHRLSLSSPLPPQKVTLTVTENKSQLLDLLCVELVNKGRQAGLKHKLVVTGSDPLPIEITKEKTSKRFDLLTHHEEADLIMVQQMVKLAYSEAKAISVVSDDTDVFILLLHFYAELGLTCNLTMEATSSDRTLIDIPATVKKHTNIVTNLLAMHCLSGCDTVGQMYGIGKGKTLRTLTAGYSLCKLGCIDASMTDVITEATQFIGLCFGSKKEDMSEIRVEMWAKTMSKKRVTSAPKLNTLPPTSEAFAQNVRRAHFQAAIWRSALSSHPPDMDATQYGWSKDLASRTLVPVTIPSDVALAPSYVLEMISCKCASKEPCRNAQCGCDAAHLPCTFFCACCADSHVCNNPFNKLTVENDENEDDDADGGNDEDDVSNQ